MLQSCIQCPNRTAYVNITVTDTALQIHFMVRKSLFHSKQKLFRKEVIRMSPTYELQLKLLSNVKDIFDAVRSHPVIQLYVKIIAILDRLF